MPPWAERLNFKFAEKGWPKRKLADESGVPYDSVLKYLAEPGSVIP